MSFSPVKINTDVMFGFIFLEGCHRADAFIHHCSYLGRHQDIHVLGMDNLNEGDRVTLAFVKANIAEKEREWHINNDYRTVEYTFSWGAGEGPAAAHAALGWPGSQGPSHPQPGAGKPGHTGAAQPLGIAHLPGLGHGPTGEPSSAGQGRAGPWDLESSSAAALLGQEPQQYWARGPWGMNRVSQDWRSPRGPDVFSKNRKTE